MRTDRQAPHSPTAKPALIRPLRASAMPWDKHSTTERLAAEATAAVRDAAPEVTLPPGLDWRPAAREQLAVTRAEPALVGILDDAAYDPEHHAIDFRLLDGGRAVACELSLAALQSLAATGTNGESVIATFRQLAERVRRIAAWKYAAGQLEADGRLRISTADLIDAATRRPNMPAAALRPEGAAELAPAGRPALGQHSPGHPIVRAPAKLVDRAL
jgi:hypothetical protein